MRDLAEILRLLIELTAAVSACIAAYRSGRAMKDAASAKHAINATPARVVEEIEKKNGSFLQKPPSSSS